MELILLQKVKNLGNLGDKVRVKPGYGRNYPRARRARPCRRPRRTSPSSRSAAPNTRRRRTSMLSGAETRKDALEGASITLKANAIARRQAVRLGRSARHRRGVQRRRSPAREERSRHGRKVRSATSASSRCSSSARRRAHDRQGRRRPPRTERTHASPRSDPGANASPRGDDHDRAVATNVDSIAAYSLPLCRRLPAAATRVRIPEKWTARREETAASTRRGDVRDDVSIASLCRHFGDRSQPVHRVMNRGCPVIPTDGRLIHRMFVQLFYRRI